MAFFTRRRGSNRVTVYYWDAAAKRQRAVPRDETAVLDNLPDEEVQDWVRKWEERSGHRVDTARRRTVWQSDEVLALFRAYQEDHLALAGGNIKSDTQRRELSLFQRYTLDYFVGEHEAKNPTKWDRLIPKFRAWLAKQDLDVKTTKKILFSLRRFGSYLVEQRVLEHPWLVRIPKRNRADATPLKIALRPDAVLKFARFLAKEDPRLAAVVLLGYFAGLRPGETYALERADFLTGKDAEQASRTYLRFQKYDLGTKLTVLITKSLSRGSVVTLPKTHYSHGFVTIWDKAAAQALAEIVRNLPSGRIVVYGRDHLNRLFATKIKPKLGVSAHDLRRASGLWLGREVGVDLALLQDHLRHADIATTALYTRRPLEEAKRVAKQDFDDVV